MFNLFRRFWLYLNLLFFKRRVCVCGRWVRKREDSFGSGFVCWECGTFDYELSDVVHGDFVVYRIEGEDGGKIGERYHLREGCGKTVGVNTNRMTPRPGPPGPMGRK